MAHGLHPFAGMTQIRFAGRRLSRPLSPGRDSPANGSPSLYPPRPGDGEALDERHRAEQQEREHGEHHHRGTHQGASYWPVPSRMALPRPESAPAYSAKSAATAA